jgi:hypothetical protein
MFEVGPNALPTVLVDRVFHCPVVGLKPGLKRRDLRTSLSFRKEFEKHKGHDERLRTGMAVAFSSRADQGHASLRKS